MPRRQSKRNPNLKRQNQPGQEERQDAASTALAIRVIIQAICTYLCFDELKEFRLINKIWKQVITAIIQKRADELDLANNVRARLCPKDFYTGLIQTIRDSNSEFPCEKFCVGAYIKPADQHLEDNLLHSVSGFVKELKFKVRSNYFQTDRKLLQCPKLTTICIEFDGEFMEMEETIENYFRNLMQNAAELKVLALNFSSATIGTILLDFIKSVRNIKNLKIDGVIRVCHLQCLADLGLKLNTLAIAFKIGTDFSSDLFSNFLETQSKTLNELHVFYRGNTSPVNITFPKMEKLTVLEIGCLTPNIKFPGLCYVEQFPILKTVILRGTGQGFQNVINTELKKHVCVETMEIRTVEVPAEIITQATRIFPMVNKLKLTGVYES